MSHASYAYLRQLSSDPAYLAAVDQIRNTSCQLYAQNALPPSSKHRGLWVLVAVLLFASLVVWWWWLR
jgi:hypothetical protein